MPIWGRKWSAAIKWPQVSLFIQFSKCGYLWDGLGFLKPQPCRRKAGRESCLNPDPSLPMMIICLSWQFLPWLLFMTTASLFSVTRVWEHSLLEPSNKPEADVHSFLSAPKPCHIAKLTWVVGYEGTLLLSVTLQGLLVFSPSSRCPFLFQVVHHTIVRDGTSVHLEFSYVHCNAIQFSVWIVWTFGCRLTG